MIIIENENINPYQAFTDDEGAAWVYLPQSEGYVVYHENYYSETGYIWNSDTNIKILDLIPGSGSGGESSAYTITDLIVTDQNGHNLDSINGLSSFVAEVNVTKNLYREGKDYLMIALFDDQNRLITFTYMKILIKVGESTEFGSLIIVPQNAQAAKVKAFVWDGLSNMQPLSNTLEL